MIDYKEVKAQGIFWRDNIAPYLEHKCEGSTSFSDYLSGFYQPQKPNSFGLASPFIYSLDFLKLHKDKQYSFSYSSGQDVNNGAAPLTVIYQFSKSLHCLANVHYWRSEEKSDGQITLFFVYENYDEVLKCIDEQMALVKEPIEEKKVGFLGMAA